jgi:hypothetical protein
MNWVFVRELPDGISVPGNNGWPRLIEFWLFGGSQYQYQACLASL